MAFCSKKVVFRSKSSVLVKNREKSSVLDFSP